MFAHRIAAFTGPDDVVWTEVAEPSCGVVVDVAAGGVSFADLLQTRGAYEMRVPLPYTPGMDAAGVVRSGPGPGSGFSPGQRVAVLVPHGCWQEVISVPPERVLPLPDGMSFEAGAATPPNYLTGLFALGRRARAQAGGAPLGRGAAGGGGGGGRPPREGGRAGGRHRARPGRERPDDGQPAVACPGGAAARARVRRRGYPVGEGEPASAR